MSSIKTISKLLALVAIAAGAILPAGAATVQITLPLGRTNYQTNEIIDIAAVRSDSVALAASDLIFYVTGKDGSKMSFTFPAAAVAVVGADARATEHLHVNAWYLRPGHYTLTVTVDGASDSKDIDVYSNIRKTTYKLVNWGTAQGHWALDEGENGLGYNLFYGTDDANADLIPAGVDYMCVDTMGGAHQMDMRSEADWSDPYVLAGGQARVARRALMDRTRPNCVGVHFYDEPGLTWEKDPVTGDVTPHAVASQHASFESAFGRDAVHYNKVNPNDPASVDDWTHWATWKLGFMDAAWQSGKFGVNYVMPDYLTATQSEYGWMAFTDGHYFNVSRSLSVTSGHGGYDDYWMMYFNPIMYLEFGSAREQAKPNWYMPTWYNGTPSDRLRMESNLVFATGIQGVINPPGLDPDAANSLTGAQSIVAGNKLYQRLGTVFAGQEQTRPPVAILDSISNTIAWQIEDPKNNNYEHSSPQGVNSAFVFVAAKMIQQPILVITDEDVADGTAAAYEKAIILVSVQYLDPKVITGLESFIQHGGKVFEVADCKVNIQGATVLPGTVPVMPDAAKIKELIAASSWSEVAKLTTVYNDEIAAKPIADKLKAALQAAGIAPAFETDQPGLSAYRHTRGEIEYLFAINTAPDPAAQPANRVKALNALIKLPADGRPVYDAVYGGRMSQFVKSGDTLAASLRFGPGQMRVFARTARPIGGVRVGAPTLYRDYTVAEAPIHIDFTAALLDTTGGIISGGAPLEIKVIDSLGETRYTLFRATVDGVANISLPLALNDPAGKWKVVVKELLANTEGSSTFDYAAMTNPGAVAGETERAVYFGDDRASIYRFFELHKDVTIVQGSSAYDQTAATRLVDALKPWDVRCTVVNAADVAHSRVLTASEAATWVGLDYAGSGVIKADGSNPPAMAGFDVRGPVVLIGNPDDNPLIKFMADERVLPYPPDPANFPGRSRGYIAWQYDMVGHAQESITAIAYDEAGMAEAIGSLYEAQAGIDPLTPFVQPSAASLAVATTNPDTVKPLVAAWETELPDYAVSITPEGVGIKVACFDGSVASINATGTLAGCSVSAPVQPAPKYTGTAPAALAKAVRSDLQIKFVVPGPSGKTAVGYWGGLVQVFGASGAAEAQVQLQQDDTCLAWLGGKLVVGQGDGRLTAFRVP